MLQSFWNTNCNKNNNFVFQVSHSLATSSRRRMSDCFRGEKHHVQHEWNMSQSIFFKNSMKGNTVSTCHNFMCFVGPRFKSQITLIMILGLSVPNSCNYYPKCLVSLTLGKVCSLLLDLWTSINTWDPWLCASMALFRNFITTAIPLITNLAQNISFSWVWQRC